jgi:hypothetical protein
MNSMTRLCLLLCTLLGATQAYAQVYKCVDEKGKTVYSQSPCPAGSTTKMMGAKPAPAPEPAAKDAAAKGDPSKPAAKDDKKGTPEEEFQKRQQARQEADKKAADQLAEQQRKQEECRRAREQVSQFDMGGRIARLDSQGERYFLDDNQIAQERAKWQAQADQACR